MATTYDEFLKRALASGQYESFSEGDKALAQQYPDYGMSLLGLKNDYSAADTQTRRLMAAETANQLRGSYGGAGDADTPVTANSGFSWSKDADPLWSAYKKNYLRESRRAIGDTLGQAAAMTGGVPSSYAVTAATQAGDYYNAQLADKIPELYELAYNRHNQDYNNALNLYQTYGYATPEAAATLGIQEGAPSADQLYKDWYMSYQDAAQAEAAKQQAYDNALALYQTYGYVPEQYAGVLGLATGTPSAEQLYQDWYMRYTDGSYTPGGSSGGSSGSGGGSGRASGSGSSGGIDNGGLTTAQIKALQNALGVTADGQYGPQSRAAAGGLDAAEAYNKYVLGAGTGKLTSNQSLALGAGPTSAKQTGSNYNAALNAMTGGSATLPYDADKILVELAGNASPASAAVRSALQGIKTAKNK